ncbi:MAG: copper oxidase [Desulfobulbus propionicus]|nr:MAG: copper oxidase [Desulfobulbus propionicus]
MHVQTCKTTCLTYLTCEALASPHGIFTCAGGVSTGLFQGLNLGFNTEDEEKKVEENRRQVQETLSLTRLATVHQVHGDRFLVIDSAGDTLATETSGYDGLLTDLPGVGLLIQHADCQAILLHDPQQSAVGAAHNGWRGSVLDVPGKIVARMCEEYGSDPANLQALIGPSLGPCCAEFIHYQKELPEWMWRHRLCTCHFDFWSITRQQLTNAGLRDKHIYQASICTQCDPRFYSYRRAVRETGGITGRNGAVIALAAKEESA